MVLNLEFKKLLTQKNSVIESNKGLIIADEIGTTFNTYTIGQTNDAGLADVTTSLTIPTKTELNGDYIGCKIQYSFANRSGAADTYTYTVRNTTKNKTLASESFSLGNNLSVSDAIFISSDKNDIGDTIQIRFTAGILGTAAGQVTLGWLNLSIQNYIATNSFKLNDVQYNQVEI